MRFTLGLLATLIAPLPGQQSLGTIDFPNSGSPIAQPAFLKGVLLLHSFEYEDAALAFREAQAADPGFAMAYWGEAMTYTHPLWNQQDLAAARAVLARLGATAEARQARAGTERERGYLDVAEALYSTDAPKARRDTLCAAALERLLQRAPQDDDARAFYALWLMGLSQGIRNVATYMRAGAIAEDIHRRTPKHPGALHYIIHAFDDPVHAPLGLHAAREYSTIAAGADHAQHMTTHIFLALGMWPETVRQNVIASGSDSANWKAGHYTSWMDYGLLQLGRHRDARRHWLLERASLAGASTAWIQGALLTMRAHYLINSEQWDDSIVRLAVAAPQAGVIPRAMDAFALGLAARRRGNLAAAQASLVILKVLARTLEGDTSYVGNRRVPGVLAIELEAELLRQAQHGDEAVARLRAVTKEEDAFPAEFGPPDIVKPTHELLGEILLDLKRPVEAVAEFTRALELAPGRSLALLGLVRAARAGGDMAAADRALEQLGRNWEAADPDALAALGQLRAGR